MKEISELLNNSHFIADYKIEEYKEFSDGFYLKISAKLSNLIMLYIREYTDNN